MNDPQGLFTFWPVSRSDLSMILERHCRNLTSLFAARSWTTTLVIPKGCACTQGSWLTRVTLQNALTALNIVTSTISVFGSGFIVLSMIILSYKSHKEDSSKDFLLQLLHYWLVFMLSVSDIMYSLAMFMGDPADGSSLCYLQAIWSNFFHGW